MDKANPKLAKQWHPNKNGNLKASDVSSRSNKKVWWICSKGHEWQAVVYSRTSLGSGCPYCSGKFACKDNCLSTINPSLAEEWHPIKNGDLTPNMVTTGSNRKAWWICKKGHEWQAPVVDRTAGSGCPYCSGKAACKDNCLATLNPELAKEWHPTKNGDITPEKVTIHSGRKVWWICKKGHEWQATANTRSKDHGCPYCAGQAVCKDNSLATINPKLAKEWHPLKNGDLTPDMVTARANKKVWWICKKGHEWQAVIYNRENGSGCPFCYSQISEMELRIYCELKYLFPSTTSKEKKKTLGKECAIYIDEIQTGIEVDGSYWHRNKYLQDREKAAAIRNSGITLINVRGVGLKRIDCTDIFHTLKEHHLTVIKKILRLLTEQCNLNEDRKKAVTEYLQRQTFINDSEYRRLWDMLPSPLPGLSLLELIPNISREWHPKKNGSLTPQDVTTKSHKKVWWLCSKGHEWQAPVANRASGHGCPFCIGQAVCVDNCLATLNPDLAKEWHPTKNGSLTPYNVTIMNNSKVWWICEKGHEWQTQTAVRSRGSGCPYCAIRVANKNNYLATLNPSLAQEWHPTKNGDITPEKVTIHSGRKVWWICNKGHEWQAVIDQRNKGSGCPYCSGKAACKDNCLATLNPELAKEWHPTKNGDITPEKVTIHSGRKVWWICNKGHEWQAMITHRNRGSGCPYCYGRPPKQGLHRVARRSLLYNQHN
ncbi:MAG: zinc-ribbon domain-containing protein [Dehalococcoidia bacterium]